MAESPARKVVMVSGCFDMLHSGHVEFFRQAAELGELHVRLGTDANIEELKRHRPMYRDAERLYMVRAVRWVHDAQLSAGSGRYDFLEDFKLLKPDLYFCNDDAAGLEVRRKMLAAEFPDIEMVVAPRLPAEGLESRSSTAMKTRLAEIARADADQIQECISNNRRGFSTIDIAQFNQSIPWRFCFAGGWMDLKWCNELHPGCVVTLNIKFNPKVCKDLCGLATSSRKHAFKLWNGTVPHYLDAVEAAEYWWGAENFDIFGSGKKPYIAGSQDHCGLLFPGINKLCYDGQHFPKQRINLNDPSDPEQAAIFKWLETVLWIVDIPFESRPGDFSSQRINHIKDPSLPRKYKVLMVKALAEASEEAWQAITTMDTARLGAALSATMAAWADMLPYTVNPFMPMEGYAGDPEMAAQLKAFVAMYSAPHTAGSLFSGAGGGYLMVISDKPVANGMQIELNHKHFCKPFPSDKLGDAPKDL